MPIHAYINRELSDSGRIIKTHNIMKSHNCKGAYPDKMKNITQCEMPCTYKTHIHVLVHIHIVLFKKGIFIKYEQHKKICPLKQSM